ncbi:MAG: DNA cytosine methyltransferase [Acidobacteriota bacterium]|nr:DNA cytosine methyltransferase [Acidobacteriota bacterium]
MADSYSQRLDRQLKPIRSSSPLVLDLFAGCGGLALGFEAQGFATHGFEMGADACATYRKNLFGQCTQAVLTTETCLPQADVVIGGPPCQPFSVGGHQMGLRDSRDGFPIFIAAVKRLNPRLWMFENVRGLFYRNHWYLDEIVAALQELDYTVEVRLLNAVHYGVPQNRERVIVVGHRGRFDFPKCQPPVTAGEALGALAHSCSNDSKFLTESMNDYVARYEAASKCIRPRDLHLDRPSRTLTCRNLAGATGDMMRVCLPDGRRRRLTLEEAKRLQSFPDWFEFVGGETSTFNQIGNAVAPLMASALARSVTEYLEYSSAGKPKFGARRRPVQAPLPMEFVGESLPFSTDLLAK